MKNQEKPNWEAPWNNPSASLDIKMALVKTHGAQNGFPYPVGMTDRDFQLFFHSPTRNQLIYFYKFETKWVETEEEDERGEKVRKAIEHPCVLLTYDIATNTWKVIQENVSEIEKDVDAFGNTGIWEDSQRNTLNIIKSGLVFVFDLQTLAFKSRHILKTGMSYYPHSVLVHEGKLYLQDYEIGTVTFDVDDFSKPYAKEPLVMSSDITYHQQNQRWLKVTDDILAFIQDEYGHMKVLLYHIRQKKWLLLYESRESKYPHFGTIHIRDHIVFWMGKNHCGKNPSKEEFTCLYFDLLNPDRGFIKQAIPDGFSDSLSHKAGLSRMTERGEMWAFDLMVGKKLFQFEWTFGGIVDGWKDTLTKQFEKSLERFAPNPEKKVEKFEESKEIVIDATLEPGPVNYHRKMADSLEAIFQGTGKPFEPSNILHSSFPKDQAEVVFHKNLMHYLTICFNAHLGIVLTPDMIFYTVLCELADIIRKAPDEYKSLFRPDAIPADKFEKKHLVVPSGEPSQIDFKALIAQMDKIAAFDTSIFTAEFSTSTDASLLATRAAFLEAMGAYFSYGNSLCGLSKILVKGTEADWQLLESKFIGMQKFFSAYGDVSTYLKRCAKGVTKVYKSRDVDHWKGFFSIDRCRSGHTDVVVGWATLFFRKCHVHNRRGTKIYDGTDFYNYESHISQVDWKNEETQKEFSLLTGLFLSVKNADNYLVPDFAHVTLGKNIAVTEDAYMTYLSTLKGDDVGFIKFFRPYFPPEENQLTLTTRKDKDPIRLKAWQYRLEKEKLNQELRPLVFSGWRDLWTDDYDYTRYRDNCYPAGPHFVSDYAPLLSELVGLNCWDTMDLSAVHQDDVETALKHFENCTNLTSFYIGKMTVANLVSLGRLMLNEKCQLKVITISTAKTVKEFPEEVIQAFKRGCFPTLHIHQVQPVMSKQILELVQAGFIKSIQFGGGGRFEDAFWQHLAQNPDCITFTTSDMDGIERPINFTGFPFGDHCLAEKTKYFATTSTLTELIVDHSSAMAVLNAAFAKGGGQCLTKLSFSREATGFDFVGKYLPNLEYLEISYRSLEEVAGVLAQRKSLKTLVLRQSKGNVADGVLEKFFQACANCKLESLHGDNQRNWGDKAIVEIAKWLKAPDCALKELRGERWESCKNIDPILEVLAGPCSLQKYKGDFGQITPGQAIAILQNKDSKLVSFQSYGRRPDSEDEEKENAEQDTELKELVEKRRAEGLEWSVPGLDPVDLEKIKAFYEMYGFDF